MEPIKENCLCITMPPDKYLYEVNGCAGIDIDKLFVGKIVKTLSHDFVQSLNFPQYRPVWIIEGECLPSPSEYLSLRWCWPERYLLRIDGFEPDEEEERYKGELIVSDRLALLKYLAKEES